MRLVVGKRPEVTVGGAEPVDELEPPPPEEIGPSGLDPNRGVGSTRVLRLPDGKNDEDGGDCSGPGVGRSVVPI